MLEIIGDRQSGKTTALVSLFLADPTSSKMLIVSSWRMVSAISSRFPAILGRLICSAANLDTARGVSRLYVDEIQMCPMADLMPLVVAYTRTRKCPKCGQDNAPGFCCKEMPFSRDDVQSAMAHNVRPLPL